MSEEIISNIQAVVDSGYNVVQFDCGAELVDRLPTWY
ncbi:MULTISPECIES: hypothetical protein [Enterobacterales]